MNDALALVISILKTTPRRWIQIAEAIPYVLFRRSPTPGEWSAYECLQHIVDTERMVFPKRVGYLLRGEDFPAFNPGDDGTKPGIDRSPAELAKEFERLRADSIDLLLKVRTSDLEKKARHQELGMVSLREMINEWAGHDLMHTVQAERALLQPFIEECGPWKVYFSDHIVGKR
ncbi:MAG: DinB family protein [Thermodesulfobacteriota bacterium]